MATKLSQHLTQNVNLKYHYVGTVWGGDYRDDWTMNGREWAEAIKEMGYDGEMDSEYSVYGNGDIYNLGRNPEQILSVV